MPARRIGVIGSCQAHVISECLRRLLPDRQIVSFAPFELRTSQQIEAARAQARECDLILTSRGDAIDPVELRRTALESAGITCVPFPIVIFFGFHPDTIVSFRAAGKKLFSGVSSDQSKLAIAAYLLGLSARDAFNLYNSYVYSLLGYFDEYAKARAALDLVCQEHGYDQADLTAEWGEDSSFMHTPNHPKLRVLWSLAKRVCVSIGEEISPTAVPPEQDWLAAKASWPVYPEIARRLGFEGDTIFRRTAGAPVDLEAFVDLSFTAFRNVSAENLSTPEVEAAVNVLRAEGLGRTQYWSGGLAPTKRAVRALGQEA